MLLNKNATVTLDGRRVKVKCLTIFILPSTTSDDSPTEFALNTEDDIFYHGKVKGIEVINENIHSKKKETISRVSYSLESFSSE